MTLCSGYIWGDLCGVFQNTMRNVMSKNDGERGENSFFIRPLLTVHTHCDESERKAPGFVAGK